MFPECLQTQWMIKDKPLCFFCELSKLFTQKDLISTFHRECFSLSLYIFAFRIQCHMADAHVHLVGSWISTKNNPLRKKKFVVVLLYKTFLDFVQLLLAHSIFPFLGILATGILGVFADNTFTEMTGFHYRCHPLYLDLANKQKLWLLAVNTGIVSNLVKAPVHMFISQHKYLIWMNQLFFHRYKGLF